MKIHCPDCHAVYNIAEAKVAGRKAKALCTKCGGKIVIEGPSGDAPSDPAPPDSETAGPDGAKGRTTKLGEFSVMGMAPKYPRYRNALIIVVVVLVLAGFLAGVHFGVKGARRTLEEIFQDPIHYIANLVFGPEKFELCGSFLDRNADRLAVLGKDLKYYPIKEETRLVKGRETAILLVRVQGSRATKDVAFQLEERQGKWVILDVVLDLGGGRQKRLFP
jgi:predicted Zn finger-like uncharacterized protein